TVHETTRPCFPICFENSSKERSLRVDVSWREKISTAVVSGRPPHLEDVDARHARVHAAGALARLARRSFRRQLLPGAVCLDARGVQAQPVALRARVELDTVPGHVHEVRVLGPSTVIGVVAFDAALRILAELDAARRPRALGHGHPLPRRPLRYEGTPLVARQDGRRRSPQPSYERSPGPHFGHVGVAHSPGWRTSRWRPQPK